MCEYFSILFTIKKAKIGKEKIFFFMKHPTVLPSLRFLSMDPFILIKRIGSDDNITLSECGEQRLQKVQAVKIQMRVSLIFYTTLYLVSTYVLL